MGEWRDKNWFNTPGPIYAAEPAFAGNLTGVALENFARDTKGGLIVCRQPQDEEQMRDLVDAIETQEISGFGINGNLLWTPKEVDKWWARRDKIIQEASLSKEWLEYINSGHLEEYLEQYKRYLKEFNCELKYLAG